MRRRRLQAAGFVVDRRPSGGRPSEEQFVSSARTSGALAARLRCPNCGASLIGADRTLACARGHRFDLARQGHVSLLAPRRRNARGDSAEMVAARETFLSAGHYAPIAAAINAAAHPIADRITDRAPSVVDLGAGTGYYLAALLEELGDWWGLALDASAQALRRALRAHPRIAAIACDVWQQLPIQDGAAHLVVNVFAPRNGAEIARILSPGGALIVVTPTPHHLHQLVPALGMLRIAPDKQARVRAALSPDLEAVDHHAVVFDMTLTHRDVHALVAMGPSAHHLDADDVQQQLAHLPDPIRVTASVNVETFRRRSSSSGADAPADRAVPSRMTDREDAAAGLRDDAEGREVPTGRPQHEGPEGRVGRRVGAEAAEDQRGAIGAAMEDEKAARGVEHDRALRRDRPLMEDLPVTVAALDDGLRFHLAL
jgi:23S rRNA (guanine745-N1)-methyltransferase